MTTKFDLILEKLIAIEKRIDAIEDKCDRMDSHINFINEVYKTVKSPLDFIIARIPGNRQRALPAGASNLALTHSQVQI
jgi:hypothetical protein